jgi:hypothetical protein
MRSSLRRATVIMILLAVFLAPGFLQARTPAWERAATMGRPAVEDGFFSMVWTLLTGFYEHGVGAGSGISGFTNKTGGQLDPAGKPEGTTTTTTTSGDTGGQLDPAGKP